MMSSGSRSFFAAMVLSVCGATAAHAGQAPAPAATSTSAAPAPLPFAYDGPPAPTPPETVARDAKGRTTVRAVRLDRALRLDGRLDEEIYQRTTPISDFIQMEPQEGAPATEKTEAWLLFDERAVYVTIRAWESQPQRMVLNEMRRDSLNVLQNEGIVFMFDTFYDRRNPVVFNLTPLGGRIDAQVTNERQATLDWNPIWDFAIGRFEGGWIVEAAVPFDSLRYRSGTHQIWGFNVGRVNRWKNEVSYVTRIPNSVSPRGTFQASLYATLVGLEAPSGARNLEIKPYAVAGLTTDANATPALTNDGRGDFGLDIKYGLTQNLTADFTYNTDFAQVEADEQQVNLTRFSLFFPEKREFFLENSGLFQFGPPGGNAGDSSDTPLLFYSRRIGLNRDREVPIRAGGRLTGRMGRFSMGALNIQTDDEAVSRSAPTNFSVIRLKRDILRRSSVGLLATRRSVSVDGAGSNDAYGVDGTFAFFTDLAVNTYWARTRTTGRRGDDTSYRIQLDYAGDRYGVQATRLDVGGNFNPEVGFVRRTDARRSYGQLRFSPRPRGSQSIRKLSWIGTADHIENGAGRLLTRELKGEFAIELHNSDRFSTSYSDYYERLERPFPIVPTVSIPVGGYDFGIARAGYQLGQQRKLSGNVLVERGRFYDGDRTTVSFSRTRVEVTPQVSLEPSVSLNWIDRPAGAFTTSVVGTRITYTVTPRMFMSTLVQFNSTSHAVNTNARLRWEYVPGSELFIVYSEERNTPAAALDGLRNRALVVKINRLFRF